MVTVKVAGLEGGNLRQRELITNFGQYTCGYLERYWRSIGGEKTASKNVLIIF